MNEVITLFRPVRYLRFNFRYISGVYLVGFYYFELFTEFCVFKPFLKLNLSSMLQNCYSMAILHKTTFLEKYLHKQKITYNNTCQTSKNSKTGNEVINLVLNSQLDYSYFVSGNLKFLNIF